MWENRKMGLKDMYLKKSRGGRPRKHPILRGPFNDLIEEAMRRDRIESLDQFADKYGIGRTTLRNFVLGRQSPAGTWVRPELPTLIRLSRALDVPLVYLLEKLYEDLGVDVYMVPSAPVVGWVGAGPGQDELIEQKYLPLSTDSFRHGNFVAFAVRGDSMCSGNKPICDGDYIIINRSLAATPGQRVVARLKDGSHVCKLYKVDRTGQFLVSANPSYENGHPSIIPISEVEEILGPVVEVRKSECGKAIDV
jgi:repressor LexA